MLSRLSGIQRKCMAALKSWGTPVLISTLFLGSAQACLLHTNFSLNGFAQEYRGTLSVALAVRESIDAGLLQPLPADSDERLQALRKLQWQIASQQMTFSRTRAEGPALMVLFTQSGVWLRLNDTQRGAIYHSDSAAQDEAVILLPDMAYPLIIKGETTLSELQERGVLRIYADDESYALNLLEDTLQAVKQRRL